jgi:hypothetical protein
VCMCVCVYVCMCACVYVCMCVCVCAYMEFLASQGIPDALQIHGVDSISENTLLSSLDLVHLREGGRECACVCEYYIYNMYFIHKNT